MVITTSTSLHASAIEFAPLPPLAASLSVACALRSNPVTAYSALSRFWAIGSPILPSPMNPTFAMASSTPVVVNSSRLLARGHEREPQVDAEQQHVHHDDPHVSAVDLRKQELHRSHGADGSEPHHRAPTRGQPQPYPRHEIDDREEHRRDLVRRRIGTEAGGKRRCNSANDRPMIKALAKRDGGHHAQEYDQPIGPSLAVGFAVRGVNRLEDLRPFRVGHGSSSSLASGAKCRSTSAAPTAASVDGCQRGLWSLSMITALTPS